MTKPITVNADNIDFQHFTNIRDEVHQLASPLMLQGIKHFSHVRLWSDKTYSLLTSDPIFSVTFVKQQFHKLVFGASADAYQAGIVFIKDIEDHCTILKKTFIEVCQMKPDLMITEKTDDHTDFYWFGTDMKFENVYSVYMNRLEMLQNFLSYFKVAGKDFLTRVYQERLVNEEVGTDVTPLTSKDWQQRMGLGVQSTVSTTESHVMLLAKQHGFSPSELSCALYLIRGLSTKEIAIERDRSYRTIEKQINKLKQKMSSRTLVHLLAQLHNINEHSIPRYSLP